MSIRESIGNLPVWKAAIIVLLIVVFVIAAIEEIFVSRILHIIDYQITHFSRVFNEESKEVDSDYQRFNEQREYDQARSDLTRFMIQDHPITPQQDYICGYEKINKKLNNFYELAYVKHNKVSRKWITKQIVDNQKTINEAISKGEFDTSKCKDDM